MTHAVDAADIVLDDTRPSGSKATIGHLSLTGPDPDFADVIRFRHLEIRDIALSDSDDDTRIAIAAAQAETVEVPVDVLKGDLSRLAQVKVDAAELSGVKLTASDGGLDIATLSVAALQGGQLGAVRVTRFHIIFPDETAGRVDLAAADFGCTDIAIAALANGSDAAEPAGVIGGCHLGEAVAATPHGTGTLQAGRFTITARDAAGRPTGGEGDLEGLTLHLLDNAELAAVLARLGIPDVVLTGHVEAHFDPAIRTVSLSETVGVEHAGAFRLDLALGHLPEIGTADPVAAAMQMTLGPGAHRLDRSGPGPGDRGRGAAGCGGDRAIAGASRKRDPRPAESARRGRDDWRLAGQARGFPAQAGPHRVRSRAGQGDRDRHAAGRFPAAIGEIRIAAAEPYGGDGAVRLLPGPGSVGQGGPDPLPR
ncbi:MAG: hypothetical protein WDN69_23200 [Aliidongia sp.]